MTFIILPGVSVDPTLNFNVSPSSNFFIFTGLDSPSFFIPKSVLIMWNLIEI